MKKTLYILAVIGVALLFCSCDSWQVFSGVIIDSKTGVPLDSAKVVFYHTVDSDSIVIDHAVYSDSTGCFTIKRRQAVLLRCSMANVMFQKKNYLSERRVYHSCSKRKIVISMEKER